MRSTIRRRSTSISSSTTATRAGDRVSGRVALYALDAGREVLPLIVERWPAGAGAAIVFTDHADRTDADALRAVLYGTSAPDGEHEPAGGFVGHGLRLTKTFFARGGPGALADDAAARRLADALVAVGSEVGSHSITEHADAREVVRDGLDTFAPWHAVTWIDHEPYTNCEAVSNLGFGDAPPYGIRDLLVARGYRWVWAATDVETATLDLFDTGPVLFPRPVDPRLWIFRSTWFGEPPDVLERRLSEPTLDTLEHRGALVVLHTYLAASPSRTVLHEHRQALVVRTRTGGGLELVPAFERLLARLGEHARRGALVVAPWREIGDRLLALSDVVVRYEREGGATIENRGLGGVRGLTVSVPRGGIDLAVEGAAVAGRSAGADRSAIWFDLPAGGAVEVHATRDGTPVTFFPRADVVVEVR
jgi:PAS domain-containing protein